MDVNNRGILTPADLIVPFRSPGSTAAALIELSKKSQEPPPPVKVADVSPDEVRQMFERHFGVDQDHRTTKQWQNLINHYGWPVVLEKESMTQDEILIRMKETLTKRMKRLAKLKVRRN